MREIKFRAFINKNNIIFTLKDLVLVTEKLFCRHEIIRSWIAKGNLPDRYTGLKDKHGKEIYEGDIVRWEPNDYKTQTGFIVYHKEYCRFNVAWTNDLDSYLKNGFHGTARFIKSDSEEPLEIIGNIYENPELLNATQE